MRGRSIPIKICLSAAALETSSIGRRRQVARFLLCNNGGGGGSTAASLGGIGHHLAHHLSGRWHLGLAEAVGVVAVSIATDAADVPLLLLIARRSGGGRKRVRITTISSTLSLSWPTCRIGRG